LDELERIETRLRFAEKWNVSNGSKAEVSGGAVNVCFRGDSVAKLVYEAS
jgi:hypothetical protein